MKLLCSAWITALLFLQAELCLAETVELTSPGDRVALAEYLPGDNNNNPILILHGLLQTREFSTVSRLASSLNDAGYSVLSPNLTLGLNRRKQSLSCEAVHTHSLQQDTDELEMWINWLHEKTSKPVTVIAHSAGGTVLLNYLSSKQMQKVDQGILISLSYYASGPEASETPEHAALAREAIKNNNQQIQTYALNYCKTYPTYPQAFLSYYKWNKLKTIRSVNSFKDHISIIMGSHDRRVDSDWKMQLTKTHNNTILIDGANHFFDQTHEFDLLDAVESILSE